jgi:hypothetical protein
VGDQVNRVQARVLGQDLAYLFYSVLIFVQDMDQDFFTCVRAQVIDQLLGIGDIAVDLDQLYAA